MAVATAQHVHKWDIDRDNHGVCSCGAEKDFPRVPWGQVGFRGKDAKLFITPNQAKKEAKEVLQKMTEIDGLKNNAVLPTESDKPFAGQSPDDIARIPVVEPVRKADFNGWCEYNRVELVVDHEKMPTFDFMHKWNFNKRQVGDMLKLFHIPAKHRPSKAERVKKSDGGNGRPVPGTLCRTCAGYDKCEMRDASEACGGYKKSGIAPNPKEHPDVPIAPKPITVQDVFDLYEHTRLQYERIINIMDATPKTLLPPLPDFAAVPDDCKAKWFEIYGKLIEGK